MKFVSISAADQGGFAITEDGRIFQFWKYYVYEDYNHDRYVWRYKEILKLLPGEENGYANALKQPSPK